MHKCGWMMITCLLFFAAGTCNEAQAQTPAHPKAATGSAAAHKQAAASPYDRALLRPALLTAKAPATYQVKFTTTKGDFVLSVTRAWAPLGADRFYNLVRHHYYDNASFFRVLKGFVVQWGISAYPPVSAAWSHAPTSIPRAMSARPGFGPRCSSRRACCVSIQRRARHCSSIP